MELWKSTLSSSRGGATSTSWEEFLGSWASIAPSSHLEISRRRHCPTVAPTTLRASMGNVKFAGESWWNFHQKFHCHLKESGICYVYFASSELFGTPKTSSLIPENGFQAFCLKFLQVWKIIEPHHIISTQVALLSNVRPHCIMQNSLVSALRGA